VVVEREKSADEKTVFKIKPSAFFSERSKVKEVSGRV